ncbi:MAG: VanZ family protein [Saprospiraceae bacterium]|nr:VanZ family protein [Saprospiraceae bacterium]
MMQRIYKNRGINLKTFIPAIVWALTILLLSVMSGLHLPKIAEKIISTDKLAHAAAYMVFCVLLMYGLRRNKVAFSNAALVSVVMGSIYGVLMEVLQYSFFPHRYFEVWDIVANIIGSLISVLVSYFFIK